jgi:hypothetical protein
MPTQIKKRYSGFAGIAKTVLKIAAINQNIMAKLKNSITVLPSLKMNNLSSFCESSAFNDSRLLSGWVAYAMD